MIRHFEIIIDDQEIDENTFGNQSLREHLELIIWEDLAINHAKPGEPGVRDRDIHVLDKEA